MQEGAEVLHGVGVGLAAGLRVQVNQVAVAVEVAVGCWQRVVSLLNLVNELREEGLKGVVGGESMLKLIHQGLLVFGRWILEDGRVVVVEVDVSHANSEVILSGGGGSSPANLLLEELLSSVFEVGPRILGSSVGTSFKLSNNFGSNGGVAPLQNMGFSGLGLNSGILSLKGLNSQLLLLHGCIQILHPIDREEISKARANMLSIDHIIRRAIGSPRALL